MLAGWRVIATIISKNTTRTPSPITLPRRCCLFICINASVTTWRYKTECLSRTTTVEFPSIRLMIFSPRHPAPYGLRVFLIRTSKLTLEICQVVNRGLRYAIRDIADVLLCGPEGYVHN